MILEKPTLRRVRRYVGIFKPKSRFQVLLVVVYAFWFFVTVLPHLKSPTGSYVMIFAAAILFGGAVLVPESVIIRWENLWAWLRASIFALFTYVVTVTLGWLPDVRSPSAWAELLLLSGGAPFSSAHALALFGMVPAWLSQTHPNARHPSFPDYFIRGTPDVMSWEQAIAIMEEIGDACGWDAEPQETPPPTR